MLRSSFSDKFIEAGCDEAGRGCLAGPVYAAAVILPKNFNHPLLNDSKKMTAIQRESLRKVVEEQALAWAVAMVDNHEIDQVNILNASFLAMHRALSQLPVQPELILVDGNRFKPFADIPYYCIVKGDGIFSSIAAASVLAKTHRDEYMQNLHPLFPEYNWQRNKGYPTLEHRKIVIEKGFSPYHRKTFAVQVKIWE